MSERSLLLESSRSGVQRPHNNELSVLFSIICIIDVFGVFPVIALPKTIIDCGFYGILIMLIVCSIQVYTAILLGKCWLIAEQIDSSIKKKNRYPYSALAELTYGRTVSNLASLLLDVTIFGGGIPNLIVASQNLQLLGLRLSNNNFDISFCYWIIILGMILCPILWLGSPKDMKLICSISVTIVISVFMLVVASLIFTPTTATGTVEGPQAPLWQLLLTSYGIISFQYDIHPTILTIQVDMKEKSKLPFAIIGGFAVSLGMFVVVTAVAAIKLGSETGPSILESLPTSIPLHFAALCVALQLCMSSAVSNNALYQHMEDCMRISTEFNHRRCVLRTTLALLAILIAESVPKFDLVMSLIGGTLTGPLVFVLPPLMYLKMLHLQKNREKQLAMESFTNIVYSTEEKRQSLAQYIEGQFRQEFDGRCLRCSKLEVALCVLIVISSVLCTIATTYVNISNAISYASFSQPCIYNVSAAIMNL